MRRLSIALVHYPVLDRSSRIITTAITNLDLHDIARSCCAYGVSDLFVVHPVAAQRQLAGRVKEHWTSGSGAKRIPDRVAPMTLLRVVESLDHAIEALGGRSAIELWTTSAKDVDDAIDYESARAALHAHGSPALLLLGTGWGLAPELLSQADVHLHPIRCNPSANFNHLSVRAACAIILDRLAGARE